MVPHTLDGKKALVTGASRGIGRAIAIGLASAGANVVLNYVDDTEYEGALSAVREIRQAGGSATTAKADITLQIAVEDLINYCSQNLGGLDVLVNNAGVCAWVEFLDMTSDVWERTQDVNHKGVFLCSQFAAKLMIRSGRGGSIITIGSVGAYTGGPLQADYNSSKAAVGSLMRSMAVALGPYGIRCNTVLPGCIETDMNASVLAQASCRESISHRTPLGRIGQPRDIVGAVLFFASEMSAFCTGAEIRVDGGILINV